MMFTCKCPLASVHDILVTSAVQMRHRLPSRWCASAHLMIPAHRAYSGPSSSWPHWSVWINCSWCCFAGTVNACLTPWGRETVSPSPLLRARRGGTERPW